jgi:hypothetical protein
MRKQQCVCIGLAVLVLATLVGVLPNPAWGQQVTAGIVGAVTDPNGAPIQGASVIATDADRGTNRPAKTNEVGFYNISHLQVGTYQLKVEAAGFQTAVQPAIRLVLNQTARVDVQMKLGKVTETVEVTGAAPVLQTQSTELSTVIDARANVALPLATRNYNQLTLLAPGAVSTNPGAFTGPQATFQVGRPYINGNREQTNNYVLDGMDNNQIDNNDVAYPPSVDAIQEFNLITQNAPADFGNYLGGVVNVSLKSGTNQFHGSVFEFFRNDVLNANNWANGFTKGGPFIPGQTNPDGSLLKPALRWNQFGAAVGGPIVKSKLFFFADYQGSRFDQPSTPTPYTVFTAKERTGDFSELCQTGFTSGICNPTSGPNDPRVAIQLRDPVTGLPFLNNLIPRNRLSPAAVSVVTSSLYPAPINGNLTSNQINLVHQNTNTDQGDLKIDWVPSQKDHVYGRYSQQSVTNPITNSQQLTGDTLNTFPLQNGVADWTRSFSPTLLNDVRVGASYFPVTLGVSNPTGQNLPQTFGIAGVPNTLLPQMNIRGAFLTLSGNGLGNNDAKNEFADTVIQAEDTVSLTKGTHGVRVGFQFFRIRTNIFYPGNEGLAGQFFFTGQYSRAGESDFMLGLPNQIGLGTLTGARGMRNSIYAAFVQDNWRVTPNLTLNLGLRWEVNTPRYEVNHLATNYGLFSGQVQLAGQNGNSDALYNQYNGITNLQPRFGFAWSPETLRNTVIRGAYGISNFAESTGTNNLLFRNPPWTVPHNVSYPTTQALPGSTLDQGFSVFPSSPCTPAAALASDPLCFNGTGIHLFDPHFRPAVSQQWNFSIQHQLGNSTTVQLGYVGQRNTHLADIYLANQLVLTPGGTLALSPFLAGNPNLHQDTINPSADPNHVGQARVTESEASSNYNAFQAVFQKRLSYGLQFQANYTWSKCLTNSSGFFAQFGDTNPALTQAGNDYFFFQNTYDKSADYGPCFNDVRNVFNGYITYDLPFGRDRHFGGNMNKVVNAIVGDWQVNTIFTVHGGFPITAQSPTDTSGTVSGFPRADCTGPPVETPYRRSTDPKNPGYIWFNPNSVAIPAAGTFGNCRVGTFRGPGLHTADLGVSKIFPFTERQNLEFRAEAINFTNTPILAAPSDKIGPSFGLVNQAQGARNIQFALKYHF